MQRSQGQELWNLISSGKMEFNNQIIDAFAHAIGPGREAVGGAALSLLTLLAGLDLTMAAIFWAVAGENFIPRFLRKIFTLGLFLWFVRNYEQVMSHVMDGFIETASLTTGRNMSALIRDPAGIMYEGIRIMEPIMNYLGGFGLLDLGGDMLFAILTLIITMLAFATLAISVTVTWIEYFLLTTLALILIPFGVFRHTAFLAERAFALAISFGVKIMVMATVIGIATPLLFNLSVPEAPSFWDMSFVMLASLTVAVLAIHAPGLAAGILAGSPSLSAGSAVGALSAGAAGFTSGASVAVGAAKGGATGAVSAAGKIAGAAQTIRAEAPGSGVMKAGAGAVGALGRGALQGTGRVIGNSLGSENGVRADLKTRFSNSKDRMKDPALPREGGGSSRPGGGALSGLKRAAGFLQSAGPEGGLSVPLKGE